MNERATASTGTFENIQDLRGVAALLVLYVYVRMLVENLRPDLDLFHAGGIGVDLFFIISGFVICLTAGKRHHTAGDFILARLARIVPFNRTREEKKPYTLHVMRPGQSDPVTIHVGAPPSLMYL
jgi:peptidoglycan/LPS O-acetylase OafA/YrhL